MLCVDVASLTNKILSVEPGLILIHYLLKPKITNKRCYQQSLTLCKYHWILKHKITIGLNVPLISFAYSYIGDFFVALHAQSFCIWSKTITKQFVNIFCCYSKNECLNTSKNSLKLFSEDVNIKVEISTDGRLVLIQCKDSSIVQIWYNKVYHTAINTSELANLSLSSFSLEHEYNVLACKFKPQNYFETASKYIANVILTITTDYKVHLWVESFMQSTVEFFRFETIIDFVPEMIYPRFTFTRRNTKGQVYNCAKEEAITSKLIKPQNDRIYKLLTQSNETGISKNNYPSNTIDWLCLLTVFY